MARQALYPIAIRNEPDGSVFITTNIANQRIDDQKQIILIIMLTALSIYFFIGDYIGWVFPFTLSIILILLFIYNRWIFIEPYLSIDQHSIRYSNYHTKNRDHSMPLHNIANIDSVERKEILFLFFPAIRYYGEIIVDGNDGIRRTIFKFSNKYPVNQDCRRICKLINARLEFDKHHNR